MSKSLCGLDEGFWLDRGWVEEDDVIYVMLISHEKRKYSLHMVIILNSIELMNSSKNLSKQEMYEFTAFLFYHSYIHIGYQR
jgi:hypothetical protein